MKPTSDHARFWQWFENNSQRLQAAIWDGDQQAREAAMKELGEASEETVPGVVLEICARREGKANDLIVSTDGNWELVDAVKDFVGAAPVLPGWSVVAFRPRDDMARGMEIGLANENVGAADVWFRVAESPYGLNLTLYVRGLTKANKEVRSLAALLFAEHVVGELDMLTLLDERAVEPLPEVPAAEGLHPVSELAEAFDRTKEKKYPPPGRLPLGAESEWASVQGTRNDAPLVGMLHLGLRAVAGHPGYDRRLTVRIPFHEPNVAGFPAKPEYLAVSDLEERLTDALQEGQQSLLALSVIAEGRRDMFFYTADADAALRRLDRFRAGGVSHDLEWEVERDSFWGLYRSFCESPDGDDAGED
jgi:hypothetical protein